MSKEEKSELKKLQEQSETSFEYLQNFCWDYCKDMDERQIFLKKLSEYVNAEIELEKLSNQ